MDIREKTEKKVFSYIEEYHMIAPRDRIVAGVSGGADSVCLLFLLLEYAKKIPLSLSVAHINHCLRKDAEEDAFYVRELCRQQGLSFFQTVVDVHRLALDEKCSLEDAGRRARYEAFRQAAEETGGIKIALAHNCNDNAETMLFHLFRGSGLKGLCGIAPVREEASGRKIIRPILCLERQEIEAYLRERQIAWRTDSSNAEDNYSRNRIRHHILPYAEQEIAAGAIGHMGRTADMLRETEGFLEQQTMAALQQCFAGGPAAVQGASNQAAWADCSYYVLDVEVFNGFHTALQKRMLYTLAKQLSPTGKDISSVHIRDMMALFKGGTEGNKSISLPFGIIVRRQYGEVIMERGGSHSRLPQFGNCLSVSVPPGEEILENPFICSLGEIGQMEIQVFFIEKGQKVPTNRYTKWFDYDKIQKPLVIRSRCTGDFFTIAYGAEGIKHKSLKSYMITEKIPEQFRDSIPILAEGSHILWLTGWRISEYYKVDGNTKRILQVKLNRSCRKGAGSETEEKDVTE